MSKSYQENPVGKLYNEWFYNILYTRTAIFIKKTLFFIVKSKNKLYEFKCNM